MTDRCTGHRQTGLLLGILLFILVESDWIFNCVHLAASGSTDDDFPVFFDKVVAERFSLVISSKFKPFFALTIWLTVLELLWILGVFLGTCDPFWVFNLWDVFDNFGFWLSKFGWILAEMLFTRFILESSISFNYKKLLMILDLSKNINYRNKRKN